MRPAVTLSVHGLDPRKATLQIAAEALTLPQLCDLLQAWIEAHPNQQPMTDMLSDWIETYGRFE